MQGDTFQACPQCCSKVSQANKRLRNINFDDLRLAAFNSISLKMDFEKTTYSSLVLCKKAYSKDIIYYQQQLWIQAPLEDGLEISGITTIGQGGAVAPPCPSLKTFLILVRMW